MGYQILAQFVMLEGACKAILTHLNHIGKLTQCDVLFLYETAQPISKRTIRSNISCGGFFPGIWQSRLSDDIY
jgi:hypothetical protein